MTLRIVRTESGGLQYFAPETEESIAADRLPRVLRRWRWSGLIGRVIASIIVLAGPAAMIGIWLLGRGK